MFQNHQKTEELGDPLSNYHVEAAGDPLSNYHVEAAGGHLVNTHVEAAGGHLGIKTQEDAAKIGGHLLLL